MVRLTCGYEHMHQRLQMVQCTCDQENIVFGPRSNSEYICTNFIRCICEKICIVCIFRAKTNALSSPMHSHNPNTKGTIEIYIFEWVLGLTVIGPRSNSEHILLKF